MMEMIGVAVVLPADVYQVIFSCLPMRRKYASRRVCRLWKHVIESRFRFPTFITSPSSCVLERVEPLPPGYDAIRTVIGTYCPADDMPLELMFWKREGVNESVLYRSSPAGPLEMARFRTRFMSVLQLNYNVVYVYLYSTTTPDPRILDLSTSTSSELGFGFGDRVDPNAILDKTRSLRLEGNFDTDLYLVDPQQNKRRRLLLPQSGVSQLGAFTVHECSPVHECYQWRNRLVFSLQSNLADRVARVLTIFDLTEFYQLPDTSAPLAPMNRDTFRADSFHIHRGTGFVTFADDDYDCFSAIDLSTGNTIRLTEISTARKQSVSPQRFVIWNDFVVCLDGLGAINELRISDLKNREYPIRKYIIPMPIGPHAVTVLAFDGEVLRFNDLADTLFAPFLQFKFVKKDT